MALFGSTPVPPSRLEELKRILQRDPTSRQFLALAEEYRKQGKLRDAIITLERGLSIHTSSVAAHVALGRVYQQLDRWEDAIRSFQNALKNDRENLVAIRHLAEVYLSKGDKLEAVKKLKLYRGLKPGDREVGETIERLEAELEPRRPERFPSGLRSLRGEPSPATMPIPTSSLRADVGPANGGGPFDLAVEPAWTASGWTAPAEASAGAQPEPPLTEPPVEPPWPATEEVFPATPRARMAERSEDETPTRVTSTPDVPAFVETELLPPPPGEWAEPPRVWISEVPPPSEPVPEPPPPPSSAESGIRRAVNLRDRYEAPLPIEMVPEEGPPPAEEAPQAETGGLAFEPPAESPEAVAEAEPVATFPPPAAEPAGADAGASESPTGPLVTETLAELYRSQGYLNEAREVYLSLAASATDPEAGRTYLRKAEALRVTRRNEAVRRQLEGLLTPFPPAPPLKTEDLSALLRSLMGEIPGLRAAALTDRAGLPVVSEGIAGDGEALEVLVAELTSFVKNVGRSGAEIGGGPLRSLAVVGENGTAILANVTSDYALILEAEPEAALGEIRWAAARAAERLRPAVG